MFRINYYTCERTEDNCEKIYHCYTGSITGSWCFDYRNIEHRLSWNVSEITLTNGDRTKSMYDCTKVMEQSIFKLNLVFIMTYVQ